MVDRNTPWEGGLVAVNSFGFGGANAHVILESERGAAPAPLAGELPRLVLASGRSEAAAQALLAHAARHRHAGLLALLDAVHARDIPGHSQRGYALLGDSPAPLQEEIAVRRHTFFFSQPCFSFL